MIKPRYLDQVRLLIQLLPAVFREKEFFLKGGTAINFFVRDIPRLSVDIDLVYGKVADRTTSLNAISTGMGSIAKTIRSQISGCQIQEKRAGEHIVSLYVNLGTASVTLETNTVLRGSVFPGQEREVSRALSQRFKIDMYVTAKTLSTPDLFGGKICAALDRQHPRDLFDIKILFENEGITSDIRKAFIVYLACHDRPMSELLAPKYLDMLRVFENEFKGMTEHPVTYEELLDVRERMVSTISKDLTEQERQFLVSIKSREPQWDLLGIDGIDKLPALQWKLTNIKKIPKEKHTSALEKLKKVLGL
jgi:predicted nucleotidyltransferase component of viral defense system